jgi:L-lactate dehydrogenase complex protein LldE
MAVHLFIPCFVDQLFPQTAVNMVTLLRQLGQKVDYNPNQTCCGQPALNAGFWEEAYDVAQKFVGDFAEATTIVCPSASCVGFVKQHYQRLLGDGVKPAVHQHFQDNLWELSEFLIQQTAWQTLTPALDGRAMYHDSCAALRECQIKESPRQLLAQVEGLELVDNPNSEVCCGFGGTFAVKFEPISVAMAEKKVEEALDLEVDYIISTDLSCLMHLDGYIQNKGLPLKTMHLADVLMSV